MVKSVVNGDWIFSVELLQCMQCMAIHPAVSSLLTSSLAWFKAANLPHPSLNADDTNYEQEKGHIQCIYIYILGIVQWMWIYHLHGYHQHIIIVNIQLLCVLMIDFRHMNGFVWELVGCFHLFVLPSIFQAVPLNWLALQPMKGTYDQWPCSIVFC